MILFVRKLIRETIGEPKTPDECLDALVRLAHVPLPEGLTAVDRSWLALWTSELVTYAQGSERFSQVWPVLQHRASRTGHRTRKAA